MVTGFRSGIHPLNRLRTDMDRVFDRVFSDVSQPVGTAGNLATFPAINVWEDEKCIYAEAELPGVALDNIDVTVVDDELTIKGERKDNRQNDVTYHRRERGIGGFVRVLHLPVDIEADKVEATMHNGVLLVTLPKAAAAQPRKIEVKAMTK